MIRRTPTRKKKMSIQMANTWCVITERLGSFHKPEIKTGINATIMVGIKTISAQTAAMRASIVLLLLVIIKVPSQSGPRHAS